MDDFSDDLDYLNDVRDAQMIQRAPRRKFEDWILNIMKMLSLYTDFDHSYPIKLFTMVNRKKSFQKRYNQTF